MSRLLEVSGLTVGYRGGAVVHEVDLVVDEGEVVALLGPNGAGKSTTLAAVAGLLPLTAGTVRFRGDAAERRPHRLARAGMALVPDDRGLFEPLTVREHLRVGVEGGGRASRAAAEARVVGWFPALGPLMDRRAGLLSGGEQQMLALAVALGRSPALLMVDELSGGLAPRVVQSLVPSLRAAAADTGCGVLLVEQHATVALEVAGRAYVMARGRVRLDTTTAHLREDPSALEQAYLG